MSIPTSSQSAESVSDESATSNTPSLELVANENATPLNSDESDIETPASPEEIENATSTTQGTTPETGETSDNGNGTVKTLSVDDFIIVEDNRDFINVAQTSSSAESSILADPLQGHSESQPPDSKDQAVTSAPTQNIQYPTTMHLPNGKVGEPFEAVLDVHNIVNVTGLEGLDAEGIHLDTANLRFYGVPTKAGEYSIRIRAITSSGTAQDLSIRLAVVPDPKSLWQDIPSKVENAYWKPDQTSDSVIGDLQLFGASKRGRSHAHKGTNRDDDFQIAEFGPNGWNVSVVADGAGSHQYSRRGSQIVTNYVASRLVGSLIRNLDPVLDSADFKTTETSTTQNDAIKTAMYNSIASTALNAAKLIRLEAELAGVLPKDYSTTLLITVVRPVGECWFIGGFNIGDGGIVVLHPEEDMCIALSSSDGGEYAGQTRFLDTNEVSDSAKVFDRLKYVIVKDFEAIVSMTDGITDPFFPTDSSLEDLANWKNFLAEELSQIYPIKNSAEFANDLLAWMDFWSAGNHDDRTITFITRPQG